MGLVRWIQWMFLGRYPDAYERENDKIGYDQAMWSATMRSLTLVGTVAAVVAAVYSIMTYNLSN